MNHQTSTSHRSGLWNLVTLYKFLADTSVPSQRGVISSSMATNHSEVPGYAPKSSSSSSSFAPDSLQCENSPMFDEKTDRGDVDKEKGPRAQDSGRSYDEPAQEKLDPYVHSVSRFQVPSIGLRQSYSAVASRFLSTHITKKKSISLPCVQ